MIFDVVLSRRAELDRDTCFDYIAARNEAGALRWLDAFQDAAESLAANPHRGIAPESERHNEEIRQRMFKTKHGLTYRMLFLIRGSTVHVIHVRGPG